jgi:predicted nucleic acid-binding protein
VIVVDASVIAASLIHEDSTGDRLRARLAAERLAAPAVMDIEVVSTLRGVSRAGHLPARRAEVALADLAGMPLERAPHGPLMPRIWELRDNLSPYDAAYVALAETLDTILLTGDARLARAPGIECEVELLAVE